MATSSCSCSSSALVESGLRQLRTGRSSQQRRIGAKQQKRTRVVMAMQSSTTMIDSHLVLGIDQNASRQEIKRAYRSLALQYHPDVCKGTDKEHQFTQINLAYQCLMKDFQSQAQVCSSASGSSSRQGMQEEEWLSEGYTFEDIFGEQQQQQQPVDDYVFFAYGRRATDSTTTKPTKVKRSCVREDW